jgi:uncharacterized Zn finger protein
MQESETHPNQSTAMPVLSSCPQCDAALAILRVIGGRAGFEYWTMRCTRCGGIHLDIVKPVTPAHAG